MVAIKCVELLKAVRCDTPAARKSLSLVMPTHVGISLLSSPNVNQSFKTLLSEIPTCVGMTDRGLMLITDGHCEGR